MGRRLDILVSEDTAVYMQIARNINQIIAFVGGGLAGEFEGDHAQGHLLRRYLPAQEDTPQGGDFVEVVGGMAVGSSPFGHQVFGFGEDRVHAVPLG